VTFEHTALFHLEVLTALSKRPVQCMGQTLGLHCVAKIREINVNKTGGKE